MVPVVEPGEGDGFEGVGVGVGAGFFLKLRARIELKAMRRAAMRRTTEAARPSCLVFTIPILKHYLDNLSRKIWGEIK